MKIAKESKQRRRHARGAALVEYALITSAMVGTLLLPFGADSRSVMERLIGAVKTEHSGYLYAASVPALPRGDSPGSDLPGGDDDDGPGDEDDGPGDDGPGDEDDGPGDDEDGPGDEDDGPDDDGPGDEDDDPDDDDSPGNGEPKMCGVPGDPDGGILGSFSAGASHPTGIVATHVGNPIHVVTGNKYQREVDLNPLPGAQGLSFVRHYNSRSRHRGSPGAGWRHNYETRLSPRGKHLRLWQADGRRIDFQPTRYDAGVQHYRAVQHGDGTLTAGSFGYEWRWRDGTALAFGRDRRLLSITDAQGNTTRLSYDAQGRLTQVRDPQQRSLFLSYGTDGRLETLTDPGSAQTRYRYDGHGNLIRVHAPDQSLRTYHYEDPHDPHNLTGITEAGVRIATWSYDAKDRAVLSQRADGANNVTLAYGQNRTTVTDAEGRQSVYESETQRDTPIIRAIRGPGCTACSSGDTEYVYNGVLQLTRLTEHDGGEQLFEYDDWGRLSRWGRQVRGGEVRWLARFAYLGNTDRVAEMARPSINPGSEHLLRVRYDSRQKPVEATESGYAPQPDGSYVAIQRSQQFTFKQGALATADGYRTDVEDHTQATWDAVGLLQSVSFPDGGSLKILARDDLGRVTQIQSDQRAPLHIAYGAAGEITSIRNPFGEIRYGYDAHRRLSHIDFGGRRLELPRKSSRPARGDVPTRVVQPAEAQAAPDRPFIARAAAGRVVRVSDARGNSTRYGIDDFGRTVFIESPDTGVTSYDYDEAGNLRGKTQSTGATASFQHDAGNRLRRVRLPDREIGFEWERKGDEPQLRRIAATADAESFEYDGAGRLTRFIRDIGGHRYRTDYRYDDQGRLIEQKLPDRRRLRYQYHEEGPQAGQLARIAQARWPERDVPLVAGLNDELADSATRDWVAGNGIVTAWQHADRRLQSLHIGGLHDYRYHYNRSGKITGIDDGDRIDQRYRYDDQGRLDFALTPAALYGYRYDANGNRTRAVINGWHREYRYAADSNQLREERHPLDWVTPLRVPGLQAAADPTPDTDAPAAHALPVATQRSGEIAALGAARIEYNPNGQVGALYRGDTLVARYLYNSRGERIGKQVFDAQGRAAYARTYLYENQLLTAEANGRGKVERQYVYLGHAPIAILTPESIYSIHTNHLGAPVAVTDERQRKVWQAVYAPFGAAQVDEDPDADGTRFTLNLRLPGQYEDAESGLHYNYHRYYDPGSGRYISSDPLGLAAGLNTFAYVANDPVNHIDPLGLLLFAFDGTGNSDPPQNEKDISNVVRFRDSYVSPEGPRMPYFYINGPGTDGDYISRMLDGGTGASMVERIAEMARNFFVYIDWQNTFLGGLKETRVDVVGFSRGAASARIFVNLLDAFLRRGANGNFMEDGFVIDRDNPASRIDFTTGDAAKARGLIEAGCIIPTLRFLGLFDTVPHYGTDQDDDLQQLQLRIPDSVRSAAHAVAVYEDRSDFHAISIHERHAAPNGGRRVEKGFLGSHSDIGGGYAEGDLSDVAFMWMVKQAEDADVTMDHDLISQKRWHIVTSPVLHNSVGVSPVPGYSYSPGRRFKYLNGGSVTQKNWTGSGMDWRTAVNGDFYNYRYTSFVGRGGTQIRGVDHEGNASLVGTVEAKYSQWLDDNYGLRIQINETGLDKNGWPLPVQP